MGRFVKNHSFHTGSYAVKLPDGSNSIGPQYPKTGQIKYNTDVNKLEVYYGGTWNEISSSHKGRVTIVKDTFVGDGATLTFTMTNSYSVGDDAMILVFIGNVFQNPSEAYTVRANQITFSSPPNNNMPIILLHNFNSTHAAD